MFLGNLDLKIYLSITGTLSYSFTKIPRKLSQSEKKEFYKPYPHPTLKIKKC